MAKHVVATVDEIAPGGRKIVEIGGRSIGVFNVDGNYYALRNRCPHQGGPLCAGRLTGFLEARVPGEYRYTRRGEILHCPWHGWEFDITTGQSWFDPVHMRVRSYPVTVEAVTDDSIGSTQDVEDPEHGTMQKGPYVAETYDVTIEKQYVLVDVPGG